MQSGIAYAGTELQAGTVTCQVVRDLIPLQEKKQYLTRKVKAKRYLNSHVELSFLCIETQIQL